MRDNLDPMNPAHKLPVSVITTQAVDLEAGYWELMEVRVDIEKANELLAL